MKSIEAAEKSIEADAFFEVYSEIVVLDSLCYSRLQREDFDRLFFQSQDSKLHKINLLSEDHTSLVSGCYVKGEPRAYITMVMTRPEARRKHQAEELLRKLEQQIASGSRASRLETVFFNPMMLRWNIPGKAGCDHPNAPGVDVSADAYRFFLHCGYLEFARQNSYFLWLSDYTENPEWLQIQQDLLSQGIQIQVYDAALHSGMKEFLYSLGNPMWIKEIGGEPPITAGGRPILIAASKQGRVLGFVGPLAVEASRRGYFAGIAVDESVRGRGIGKVLFSSLCMQLRDMGAEFMTLFTGVNNPARLLYEASGFQVVKTWANLRKEL